MNEIEKELAPEERVVELVKQAKRRPFPRSSKVLLTVLVMCLVFTGGLAFGKQRATSGTGAGLTLAGLNSGNLGALAGGRAFGGGRIRNNAGAVVGAVPGGASGDFGAGGSSGVVATPTDVAGTVDSVTETEIVIITVSGEKQTFPISETTKVRESTILDLEKVKSGDIVTIKPDDSNGAKTIMVVK